MKPESPQPVAIFPNSYRLVAWGRKLFGALLPYRRIFVAVLQIGFIILANYFAFWLRFDGQIPALYYGIWLGTLTYVVITRTLIFIPFRLYEGLWRYSSIHDLRNIVVATLSGTVLIATVQYAAGLSFYPRSIYFVDSLLLIFMLGGSRLGRRLQREIQRVPHGNKILIYGAGDAGEMIVRDMKNNLSYHLKPVGFIDDSKSKVGQRIHGVPVLGTRAELPQILRRTKATEILLAMPTADTTILRGVVTALRQFKISIKTLPNLNDILNGKVNVGHIRDLAIEDLLPRVPVGLDQAPVRKLIHGKNVLITGAGGSIGSELARQIAGMGPKKLVLLDRYENGLHEIHMELRETYRTLSIEATIADITDEVRVRETLQSHRPNILFHAAAHKHVPLMEGNPCEAIKNNVRGTRLLVEGAEQHGVDKFVLISTDKAVNPSSIMGASKRIAELITQNRVSKTTDLIVVRFGNVLGSNGSVVPHFLKQIRNGGPVTVTHPEMKRYFMLIPEAAQLVLQAAAIGESESIYVLDMGSEFGVVDVARNLIRLCGYIPEGEIPIVFTGLRPGEKLSEELVGRNETAESSGVDKVSRIRSTAPKCEFSQLQAQIQMLEKHAFAGDIESLLTCIARLVPEYGIAIDNQTARQRVAGAL